MPVVEFATTNPWISTSIAAAIAILIALIVHRLASPLLRRATQSTPALHSMFLYARRPAGWVLPFIAMQAVWQATPDSLDFIDSVRHLNGLMLIATTTWLAVRSVKGFAEGIIRENPWDVADNLNARRILTQTRVLSRTLMTIAVITGLSMMLMTFTGARQVGASLLASAGIIGIVAGLAAKPVFSNLIAGMQIAMTQPIRLDDVLVVEGEWGRVEEITGTFVVLRIWDDRRLILPLSYFIERPFQNWTRHTSQLLGSLFLYVDYRTPLAPLRAELERVIREAPDWDGRFFNLQVTDLTERTMQLRILCTAASSSQAFDLRCHLRERMIDFMQRRYPQYLPQVRLAGEARDGESSAGTLRYGLEGGVERGLERDSGLERESAGMRT
ncbi:MAG TPA: mechanosensitive ion channel [Burkholderiaceae bacterium]|nr:mechanosensitive ion channel [Burkholderiaceae bacterium]